MHFLKNVVYLAVASLAGVSAVAGEVVPFRVFSSLERARRADAEASETVTPLAADETGCYRFKLPKAGDGDRLVLRFEGAAEAFQLMLNGECVGSTTGRCACAAFDVTDLATPEENVVSCGSATSAVCRAVSLARCPAAGLRSLDVSVSPVLGDRPDGDWLVKVTADVAVTTTVFAPDGERVQISDDALFLVERPQSWNPERPSCYTLVVSDGHSFVPVSVCFRQLVFEPGVARLNGRKVALKAATRSLFDELLGPVPSRERMESALRRLRRAHVNAVGADWGPCDRLWELLCDAHGVMRVPSACLPAVASDTGWNRLAASYRDWSVSETGLCRRVIVYNRQVFSDSTGVICGWQGVRNGAPFAEGTFDIAELMPQDEKMLAMPAQVRRVWREQGGVVSLRVTFSSLGEIVAEDQIDFPVTPEPLAEAAGETAWAETPNEYVLTAGRTRVAFAKATGLPASVQKVGWLWNSSRLAAPMRLSDGWTPVVTEAEEPFARGTNACGFATSSTWRRTDGAIVALKADWTLRGDGTLVGRLRFAPTASVPMASVPALVFPAADADVTWLGCGPHAGGVEAGAFVGRWSGDAAEMSGDYPRVYGFALDGLAVRALGEPFALRADGCGPAVRLRQDATLDFTISLGDDELVSRQLATRKESK